MLMRSAHAIHTWNSMHLWFSLQIRPDNSKLNVPMSLIISIIIEMIFYLQRYSIYNSSPTLTIGSSLMDSSYSFLSIVKISLIPYWDRTTCKFLILSSCGSLSMLFIK